MISCLSLRMGLVPLKGRLGDYSLGGVTLAENYSLENVLLKLLLATAGAAAASILLFPATAFAWGPLAHLDFGAGALESLELVPVAVRVLLGKCPHEFLYGTLAADIVVGKNLARYGVHCHNWKVGFQVLAHAEGEPERSFAYGFLAHLAADTVAHNYYVPYKTVEGYTKGRTGHAYWELRYDQRLSPDLWKVARRVSGRALRRHDHFLEDALAGSAVLPFGLSKGMFESLLLSAKLRRWQQMSKLLAGERDLPLAAEEVAEMRKISVAQIVGMLRDGREAECVTADPTGLRNLHMSMDLRKKFKKARARGLRPEQAASTLKLVRDSFRAAIHGPLHLPHLEALYEQHAGN
jgi:Zinc dependent phospholipase C